jgi:hypothetical protein
MATKKPLPKKVAAGKQALLPFMMAEVKATLLPRLA